MRQDDHLHDQAVRRCSICESGEARWLHTLDAAESNFRVHGKGHTWAHEIVACDSCEELLTHHDVEALVGVTPRMSEESEQDVDERIRNGLVALVRADRGSIPFAQSLPTGYTELLAEGFVPLMEVTGAVYLAAVWPDDDRRAVPETRASLMDLSDDGMCWFVRSPWPSIPLQDVLNLIWAALERELAQSDNTGRFNEESEKSLARDVLSHDLAWIQRQLESD